MAAWDKSQGEDPDKYIFYNNMDSFSWLQKLGNTAFRDYRCL